MFFEKIQKLRVLMRSKNKQQANYAKTDLEFNKLLFRNQSISAALLSYKVFFFFVQIDEEELDMQEYNKKKLETKAVDRFHKPRDSEVLEVDDKGRIIGASKLNFYIQDPGHQEKTFDLDSSYFNPHKMAGQSQSRKPTYNEMEGKKAQLVEAIQSLTKQTNCKQQAIVLMTGMMRCLDELILPGVRRAEKAR